MCSATISSQLWPEAATGGENPRKLWIRKYKNRKGKNSPTATDHSYNLLGNHTHRIAEALNLAGGGRERRKGEGK